MLDDAPKRKKNLEFHKIKIHQHSWQQTTTNQAQSPNQPTQASEFNLYVSLDLSDNFLDDIAARMSRKPAPELVHSSGREQQQQNRAGSDRSFSKARASNDDDTVNSSNLPGVKDIDVLCG
jgi:hypothetical protein